MTAIANDRRSTPLQRGLLLGGAALLAAALAAAVFLWARYGTTVFFEMIAAGIAYCF
jgi:hypothetical protein